MEILLHKPDANGTPKNYIYKVIQYPVSINISLVASKIFSELLGELGEMFSAPL